jgi:hypothetical protein
MNLINPYIWEPLRQSLAITTANSMSHRPSTQLLHSIRATRSCLIASGWTSRRDFITTTRLLSDYGRYTIDRVQRLQLLQLLQLTAQMRLTTLSTAISIPSGQALVTASWTSINNGSYVSRSLQKVPTMLITQWNTG